jgi:hypothetical protein
MSEIMNGVEFLGITFGIAIDATHESWVVYDETKTFADLRRLLLAFLTTILVSLLFAIVTTLTLVGKQQSESYDNPQVGVTAFEIALLVLTIYLGVSARWQRPDRNPTIKDCAGNIHLPIRTVPESKNILDLLKFCAFLTFLYLVVRKRR